MAITIHTQPQELSPCYNPMIIAVTSSNQSLDSFQFVGDIYVDGTLVTRMKVPVNPDGYGVFDIHRHVENQITYTFEPDSFGWTQASDSFATYSVEFSEEFRFDWPYYDFVFDTGNVAFLGLSGGVEPLFNIGDQIFITGDAATPDEYRGVAEITNIQQAGPSAPDYNWVYWLVTINKTFQSAAPVGTGGTMSLANFGLNIVSVTASTGVRRAWNGVYNYLDFIDYDYTDYVPNASSPHAEWLTNVPNNWKLGTQSRMKLLLYKNAVNQQKDFYVKTNRGTYRITSLYSGTTPLGNDALTQIACGPYDLTNNGQPGFTSSIVTGTSSLPIFDSNTSSYEIWTQNQILQVDTMTMSFQVEDACSRYEKFQIIFMDKLGSFVPYTFNKVSRDNRNISRSNYQQYYGQYAPASQNWSYNSYDRGTKNLDTVVTQTFTINSDWVNQSTSDYLMELFESPEVYWIKEDGTTVAINITDTQVERKQTINDQIINYTLTFNLSNKNMQQKG